MLRRSGFSRRGSAAAILLCGLSLLVASDVRASVSGTRHVIDFNELAHGQIVDNEFSGPPFNLSISGVNIGGGPDLIVAFDTFETGTADPDLEDPFDVGNANLNNVTNPNTGFDTTDLVDPTIPANLPQQASRFQLALIIQENGSESTTNPGFVDSPADDEGSRPAGSIFFDFEESITEIGFDLLDVEGPEEFGADSGFVATFLDEVGNVLANVSFDEFLTDAEQNDADTDDGFFANPENPVEFGNNSANRILPITAEQLSDFTQSTIDNFRRVELNFGGSGAVDNLVFAFDDPPDTTLPVPEASSVLVWALLGLAVSGCGRRTDSSRV